jgi:sulfatase maturation enzyme AslB (radical SAM superfamily)
MAKEPKPAPNQLELGISETWNHDYLRNVRRRMVAGEWLPECSECEHLERNGIMSSRQWENAQWEADIQDIVIGSSINEWKVDYPLQFDFRLGNMCNLKCQMCNKEASHLVSVERAKMLDADLAVDHCDWKWNHATKKEALLEPGIDWDNFIKMLPTTRKIKIIGGEPTVAADMFTLLDVATDQDHAKHIELSFYTNITNMQDKWLVQLGKFKKVIVNCSLEGMDDMNDYLRPPSNWKSVWNNFTKLVDFSHTPEGKNIKVRVTTVNQITNALHIVDFWRFLHSYQSTLENGIGVSTNQLIEPDYYSMSNAPTWLKDQQEEQILAFLNEIKDSKHYKDYAESLMEIVSFGKDSEHIYNADKIKQYIQVTENYDKFRGHDILSVSPEFSRLKDNPQSIDF